MRALRAALADPYPSIPLDIAALEIASIQFPRLNPQPTLKQLDDLAQELRSRVADDAPPETYIEAANRLFFEEWALSGNSQDYYDPENSCLNSVLARRLGIPISLCVVYMEVSRRLNRPVRGIGLPGHFIVEYADSSTSTFIDPFHEGKRLSREDCLEVVKTVTGEQPEDDLRLFTPATNQQILFRMLTNLRAIYVRAQLWSKARQVLDLLVEAQPDSLDNLRVRGVVLARLRQFAGARHDLERYLALDPECKDKDEIHQQLKLIQRWQANLN